MKSSHRGAPASPLTPSGVESSVSHGRRPLRESLDIRALPPSRRPRPSRERQTGVTGRFPVRRAEPTFLADEMSAPADFQVNDAVSEERTSGRSNALSVRTHAYDTSGPDPCPPRPMRDIASCKGSSSSGHWGRGAPETWGKGIGRFCGTFRCYLSHQQGTPVMRRATLVWRHSH